jgi:hypothetical protein
MMKLFILNGKDRGCLFDLKNDTSYVGRSSDNDIQINDSSISRKHLMVLRKKDKFVIEDLLSRNGTFVNGTRINAGEGLEVAAGIPISIGNVYFSLGKSWAGDVLPVQDSMGESDNDLTTLTNDISRPMTTPRNLELIYKVSNVLMQSLDINIILEKILDYIFDLLRRIDRGVIILIDHETGKILEVISRANMNGDDV